MTRRSTHSEPISTPAHAEPHQEVRPDAAAIETENTDDATDLQAVPSADPMPAHATKVLTGKLAGIIEHISRPDGATIADLMVATGWQPHTVRAALSRLRRRGYTVTHSTDAEGRKAYRLQQKA